MTDAVVSAAERAARAWKQEADDRRKISRVDPIADTLEYCASELAARMRDVATEATDLSVEEFAKKERVTPQTVRNWIRRNRLPAKHGAKGYRIPAGAVLLRSTG